MPYAKPWGRTREYIEVVREIIAREGPVDHQGEHYKLPLPGGGECRTPLHEVCGEGKPLRSEREDEPVRDAARGLALKHEACHVPLAFGERIVTVTQRFGRIRMDFYQEAVRTDGGSSSTKYLDQVRPATSLARIDDDR